MSQSRICDIAICGIFFVLDNNVFVWENHVYFVILHDSSNFALLQNRYSDNTLNRIDSKTTPHSFVIYLPNSLTDQFWLIFQRGTKINLKMTYTYRSSEFALYMTRYEKMCLRVFPTRSDTNRPAQPQKLARVLKFRL